MKFIVKHAIRITAGVAFLLLGIAGLFLPVLQGLLFLAIGLVLLAPYIPLFARIRDALYRRFPRVKVAVERWKKRWKRTE